jgi:hypothetical protein
MDNSYELACSYSMEFGKFQDQQLQAIGVDDEGLLYLRWVTRQRWCQMNRRECWFAIKRFLEEEPNASKLALALKKTPDEPIVPLVDPPPYEEALKSVCPWGPSLFVGRTLEELGKDCAALCYLDWMLTESWMPLKWPPELAAIKVFINHEDQQKRLPLCAKAIEAAAAINVNFDYPQDPFEEHDLDWDVVAEREARGVNLVKIEREAKT